MNTILTRSLDRRGQVISGALERTVEACGAMHRSCLLLCSAWIHSSARISPGRWSGGVRYSRRVRSRRIEGMHGWRNVARYDRVRRSIARLIRPATYRCARRGKAPRAGCAFRPDPRGDTMVVFTHVGGPSCQVHVAKLSRSYTHRSRPNSYRVCARPGMAI